MTKKMVYLGPSMVRGRDLLTHGTIYAGVLPPSIVDACSVDADLRSLFADVDDVARSRQDIVTENTYLGAAYKKVKAAYESTKVKKV